VSAVEITVTFSTERPLSQSAGKKFWLDASRFDGNRKSYRWQHTVRDATLGNAVLAAEQVVHQIAFEDGTEAELISVAGEVVERTLWPKTATP
jgi:hypothetical protein